VRVLAIVFVVLIATLQYPMWLGKGGWLMVRDLDRKLAVRQADNAKLQARNDALEADVRDLKTGFEAIEERARSELGMIRGDEVFFGCRRRAAARRPRRSRHRASERATPRPHACCASPRATTRGCVIRRSCSRRRASAARRGAA